MKKYRITTTHTVIASSQQEALQKVAMMTTAAGRPKENVKIANQLADDMIAEAVKWAGKWGRTSGVGFINIYSEAQGITVLDKAQVANMLGKQKDYLVDAIQNDGVCSKGTLKGRTFDLTDGDIEDKIMEIFIDYMARMGIAIAATENVGTLKQVFNKLVTWNRKSAGINSKDSGGISDEIAALARFSYKNIKPAYKDGIDGWKKLFKKLNEAA